jgi:hypothetical protein
MTTWRKFTVALVAIALIVISTWVSRPLDGNAVAAISAIVTAFVVGNAVSNWRRPGDPPAEVRP